MSLGMTFAGLSRSHPLQSAAHNDDYSYLHAVRSVWSGLSNLFQEGPKEVVNPCLDQETEVPELLLTHLDVKACFVLTDPHDPRYQRAVAHRLRYGRVIHQAALALQKPNGGEDHIDALISLSKAIDVYLLEYAMTRSNFDTLRKSYAQAREQVIHFPLGPSVSHSLFSSTRMWSKQRATPRMVLIRRAHAYHGGRVYMHALYRRRSQVDDDLLRDLIEMSLSPYTRLRR